MDNVAKNLRAAELLSILRTTGWTNAQFWEAQQLGRSVSRRDADDIMVDLLFAWSDVESDRIDSGTHEPCDAALDAELNAKWPIAARTSC